MEGSFAQPRLRLVNVLELEELVILGIIGFGAPAANQICGDPAVNDILGIPPSKTVIDLMDIAFYMAARGLAALEGLLFAVRR